MQDPVPSSAQPLTQTRAPTLSTTWRRRLICALPPFVLFLAAVSVTWQYDPLHRTLTGDHGVFAYLAQLVADGFVPHKYAFNEQASLTFFIGGAVIRVGDVLGVHRLLALRAASIVCFAVVILLTYALSWRWTRSVWAAFAAGAILIGFEGFAMRAAVALEPKTLMLVFGLATLLVLQKRQWFWAGVLAGLAGLVWQIAWGYLIVALLLAFVQGGARWRDRARAFLITLAPALILFGAYVLYFAARGALVEMVQQSLYAPAVMHAPGERSVASRAIQLYNTFLVGYRSHLLFGVLGVGGFLLWLTAHLRPWEWRKLWTRSTHFFFTNARTAGTLLAVCGFTLYSFLDFQNYPDWIPLLPYLALFAAWLLWQAVARVLKFLRAAPRVRVAAYALAAVVVLGVSATQAFIAPMPDKRMQNVTWQDQQQAAQWLNQTLGPDESVWIVGRPELLFMLRRQNLNKYIYLFGNVDGMIDEFDPGGFPRMLDDALAQKPALVVLSRLPKRKFTSPANYRALENVKKKFVMLRNCRALGEGTFFVREDLADLFPAASQGCLKQ